MRYLACAALSLLLLHSGCRTDQVTADHVYVKGRFWTGDSTHPWASVLALRGDSIVYVGDDDDRWKAEQQTIITSLDGKLVVPGLIDNHTNSFQVVFNCQASTSGQ